MLEPHITSGGEPSPPLVTPLSLLMASSGRMWNLSFVRAELSISTTTNLTTLSLHYFPPPSLMSEFFWAAAASVQDPDEEEREPLVVMIKDKN
jgi:hypothetical protein